MTARWFHRVRRGWAFGRWVFGYEKREYQLSFRFPLYRPLIWLDEPETLAQAPVIDREALQRRMTATGQAAAADFKTMGYILDDADKEPDGEGLSEHAKREADAAQGPQSYGHVCDRENLGEIGR